MKMDTPEIIQAISSIGTSITVVGILLVVAYFLYQNINKLIERYDKREAEQEARHKTETDILRAENQRILNLYMEQLNERIDGKDDQINDIIRTMIMKLRMDINLDENKPK